MSFLQRMKPISFRHGKLESDGGGLASKPILTFMLTTVHAGSISPLTILLLPYVISTIT